MLCKIFLRSLWQNGKEKNDMLEVKFYDTAEVDREVSANNLNESENAIMSLGLKRGKVHLEQHDKVWENVDKETIEILTTILGEDAILVQFGYDIF